ncbi:MAG: hypothetical protein NTZ62_09240 [Actinobacteria bacterium]|nr:hypothetical protein [Actinomycetota bacterium]
MSGDSTTITPVFSRGTATVNHSVGTVTSGVGFVVSPTVATMYTLTVTNSDGATATTTVPIAVNSLSITTQPQSLTVLDGLRGRLAVVASGTGTVTYQWSNSSGIIDADGARSDAYQATVAEAYTVTVTSTLNGTTVSKTSNIAELSVNAVTITTQPQTVTLIEGGDGICTVRATATGVMSYQWYIDDVLVVGGTSRDLPVTTESNCKAVVTSTLAGTTVDARSTSANVWINSAVIASQPTDSVFTAGSFIPISVGLQSAAIGQTFAYQWFRGGVAISSANSATYNASIAGSYYVEITATMNATVSTKNSATVIVSSVAAPLIASVVAGSSRIASGSSTTITAVFSGGSAVLTPGNTVLSSGVVVTVSPTVSTTYSVTVTNAAGTPVSTTTPVVVETGVISVLASQLSVAHVNGVSIRLGNGKVLILGGTTTVAELFDPVANTFSATGSMVVQRTAPAVVLLKNGKVLVMGGQTNQAGYPSIKSAELYDPATGLFTATGDMAYARLGAMAVLLDNGKVLIAGGRNANTYHQSAELYDPMTGVFSGTWGMNEARAYSTAVLLSNGNVLVVGGENYVSGAVQRLSTATIYDVTVAGGYWRSVSSSMNSARTEAMFVSLSDGRLLIVGGRQSNSVSLASTELFDPATMTFAVSTPTMDTARFSSGVVKLSDGSVLIVGGYSAGTYYDSILLFDPTSNAFFNLAPKLTTVLYNVQATLLIDGRVLINGGDLKTAFLYTP